MVGKIMKSTRFKEKVLSLEFMNIEKSNAISLDMLEQLNLLLEKKKYIRKFSLLVFKGYKNGPFSSGADLQEIIPHREKISLDIYQNKLQSVLDKLKLINIPKISLINSHCFGAGLILAMHTDIVISNSNGKFSIPAVKLGIKLPKKQIRHLFSRNINDFFLKEILISGRKFDAYEAYNAKMISFVIEDKNFLKKCDEYLVKTLENNTDCMNYYLIK